MSTLALMRRAKRFCEENKYRLTKPRVDVLRLLASNEMPASAYDILHQLSLERRVSPPTVYRAISFWEKHGFIHRVESINAYIACCQHSRHTNFSVFICKLCEFVRELDLNTSYFDSIEYKKNRLTITSSKAEVYGTCHNCHCKGAPN